MPRLANQPPVDVEADLAVVDRRHVVGPVGRSRARRPRARPSGTRSSRSPSSARERTLSSIPKMTSPCGSPAVSSARFSISFASPAWRIRSVRPLSRSNACLDRLRDRERVVRDQHDLRRLRSPRRRTRPRCSAAAAARERRAQSPRRLRARAASGRGGAGADREEDALGDRIDACLARREDVGDAAARARLERLVGERVLEPVRGDARRRAAEREERQRARRRSRASVRSPRIDVDERVADERVELERRVALRAQQEERGERGGRGGRRRSRRRARAARRARRPRRARARGRWRPSRRGGARRARRPPPPRASAPVTTESRSPTTTSTSSPSAAARSSAAVRGDDGAGARAPSTAGPAPRRRPRRPVRSRASSAGITQIRFCGSAAR